MERRDGGRRAAAAQQPHQQTALVPGLPPATGGRHRTQPWAQGENGKILYHTADNILTACLDPTNSLLEEPSSSSKRVKLDVKSSGSKSDDVEVRSSAAARSKR